jgi:hypothetical protein
VAVVALFGRFDWALMNIQSLKTSGHARRTRTWVC